MNKYLLRNKALPWRTLSWDKLYTRLENYDVNIRSNKQHTATQRARGYPPAHVLYSGKMRPAMEAASSGNPSLTSAGSELAAAGSLGPYIRGYC